MNDKEEGWKKAGMPGPEDQNIIKELNKMPDPSFAEQGDLLVAIVETDDEREEALNDAHAAILGRAEEIEAMEKSEASGLRGQVAGLRAAAKIITEMDNEDEEDSG